MSGRIVYRKVLGAKNPADLMTKHMTAELSNQHLKTLNMNVEDGRAKTAPTIDNIESFVQGWYVDLNDESEIESQEEIQGKSDERRGASPVKRDSADGRVLRRNESERRNVTFHRRVQVRPIPAEGRGTRTPGRGWST